MLFKGYLAKYVRALSGENTLNIRALAKEAVNDDPRLMVPLLLYAVYHGKTELLRRSLAENNCGKEILKLLDELETSGPEEALRSEPLYDEYRKVVNSFRAEAERPANNEQLKDAMRSRILEMQRAKNCSNYRIYTDLKLNPGNINEWLKNGDSRKVSYRTAERIVSYLMSF